MRKDYTEDEFPPELMDTSRVTERGSTYKSRNTRSKSNSVQFSNTSYISPTMENSNPFSRLTVYEKPILNEKKQRQTVAVDDEINQRTKPKMPVYREIELPQPCRIKLNYNQNQMKPSKLLQNKLKGKAWEYCEMTVRQELLVPILKTRPLEIIREKQHINLSSYPRQSGQSIDSEQYIRSNPSSDINQE